MTTLTASRALGLRIMAERAREELAGRRRIRLWLAPGDGRLFGRVEPADTDRRAWELAALGPPRAAWLGPEWIRRCGRARVPREMAARLRAVRVRYRTLPMFGSR